MTVLYSSKMATLFKSQVVDNQKVNDKFHHLVLKLNDQPFSFKSGQFVVVRVGKDIYRSYSIASYPGKMPFWEIVVDITPGGPGSVYLSGLKKGDIVETTNPRGIFTLAEDNSSTIILVATGCGISSIRAMIEELIEKRGGEKIILFWGLRHETEIFDESIFQSWQNSYSNFQYQIVISQPVNAWEGKRGHVTEHIIPQKLGCDPKTTSVYLCGGEDMVRDVSQNLKKLGLPSDKIYFEKLGVF